MIGDALVEVKKLTKIFGEGDAAATVLDDINLQLKRGELAALLGPSGSGKSTLLTILGTLLKPTSGVHHMLGVDLTAASEVERTRFRNQNLGFVFQFHHLLPDLSALENVMMPAAAHVGRETAAMRLRAADLLDAVGLSERRAYRPAAMSGGQRQRVAVARALMNKPALVLADEPTGNLDRQSADRVMSLIAKINEESGCGFLISTHDEHISARCRRKIEVLDGKLTAEGSKKATTMDSGTLRP